MEAAIVWKRTGPEDFRPLAEALHQLRVAQAYNSKVTKPNRSLNKAILVLGKRKKNLEKRGLSHSINRGVASQGDHMKDGGNVVPEYGDRSKNQSEKRRTSRQGRTDSIVGRVNRENSRTWSQYLEIGEEEEARVEVRKRPSIIISILFDRWARPWTSSTQGPSPTAAASWGSRE